MAWLDSAQMFQLIDSLLPFEACLYHQVLPLSVEGSRLNLGMVNLEDTAALDYVRRILAYINCSLVPRSISSEIHQKMLSAYLSHADQQKQKSQKAAPRLAQPSTPHSTSEPRPVAPPDRNNQPTLVVDSPDKIDIPGLKTDETEFITPTAASPGPTTQPSPIQSTAAATKPPAFPEISASPEISAPPDVPPTTAASSLPILDVHPHHLSSPIEVLTALPPKNLLDELLGRVLVGGIGRLYFERQQHQGRILWSQNGVLQSVLENLPAAVFQGVINELKRLTNLPMIPVQKPRQEEVERLYQQSRLLLRFRVMPGTYGEEATLQVLRGAALKFYQQQQLANLSRDALGIAQQLQRKLDEIRDRAETDLGLSGTPLEALPALNQLLQSVDQQLKNLNAFQAGNSLDQSDDSQ
jgi:type II secretory ATPase GspE/PulE/Tfp pilus assembly ATPase PilB-like protein